MAPFGHVERVIPLYQRVLVDIAAALAGAITFYVGMLLVEVTLDVRLVSELFYWGSFLVTPAVIGSIMLLGKRLPMGRSGQ
jgi:hypothetical protein